MEEIDLTVFQCPVCGGVLDFGDQDETNCKSCGNKVHKFKTKTEVNLKVEYAMVSDGSRITSEASLVPQNLFEPMERNAPRAVLSEAAGADIVRLDGLTKRLVWNYAKPNKLHAKERAECAKLAGEILAIDPGNIYGRFIEEIAFPSEVSVASAEQLLTRCDAVEIAEYVLPVLREKEYQGLEVSAYFVNYIVNCRLSCEEKYNNMMAVLTSKYLVITSLNEVKPILIDILGLKLDNAKRFKLIMLLYASIASLTGETAVDQAAGFMRYVMLSDLTETQRATILANFVKFSVGRFKTFDQTVMLLESIQALELADANKQQIIMNALAKCVPKNMSFEGYFNLSGYIHDAACRFQYLFYLFLGSYDSVFFKLKVAELFYHQHRLSADEMLLFLDMTRVFAVDNVKPEKVNALRNETEELKRSLNLCGYDASLLKNADIKGFFNFLKRYEETKPSLIVQGMGDNIFYTEETEKALYSLSTLRLYYHRIYDFGIVAPYTTLDRLDDTVAHLNEIKAQFVKSGGSPFEIKGVGGSGKRRAGVKATICNALTLLTVFLLVAGVTLTFLPAYAAFSLSAVWTIILAVINETKAPKWVIAVCGAIALGGLYLLVYTMFCYIFRVNKPLGGHDAGGEG